MMRDELLKRISALPPKLISESGSVTITSISRT